MDKIVIYTDGSSRGNPGPGGYGALLIWGEKMKELSGAYRKTTNNRMELLGVIKALLSIKKRELPKISAFGALLLVLLIFFMGSFKNQMNFIYFQF